MTILEACMQGCDLTMPDADVSPVDFVGVSDERTVVFLMWWWMNDWHTGGQLSDAVMQFDYPLIQVESNIWHLDSPVGAAIISGSPTDASMEDKLAQGRRWQAINKGEYLMRLGELRQGYAPEFDFSEWSSMVVERLEVDAVDEFRRANLGNRKIGSILLINQDNERVDALVLDERGNAATAGGNPWLLSFANDWSEAEDRPDVEDYVNWIAQKRPYGPYSVEKASATFADGHVEDLAVSLLTGRM